MAQGGHLYYGDNLDVLRRHVASASVDLVYLDPPFNSDADYNVLFPERDGSRSAAQIRAFTDTWRWDQASAYDYQQVVEQGGTIAQALRGLRTLLGDNDLLAYLSMMAPRLIELRRVLKPTGSIYLHCDPTASHYLKLIMDAIFGAKNFQNEVIWHHGLGAFNKKKGFPSKHDTLLFYSRTADFAFNKLRGEVTAAMNAKYSHEDEHGRYMMSYGKKYYLKGGKPFDDVWDIPAISPSSGERLGFPTQKPLALLERVVEAATVEGDVILDPFCGCGTAVSAAQRLNRSWVGIDITHLAISLIKYRLQDEFGKGVVYDLTGEPTTVSEARELAAEDPYQFQWWALGLVDARPVETKKGSDKGIDGRLYFHDEGSERGNTKQVIFSVKAGKNVGVAMIRDLAHVVNREDAQIGVFVSMAESTQPMRSEAASAGYYHSPWTGKDYPRIQLRTVAELLEGLGFDYPAIGGGNLTFRRARKAERPTGDQLSF